MPELSCLVKGIEIYSGTPRSRWVSLHEVLRLEGKKHCPVCDEDIGDA